MSGAAATAAGAPAGVDALRRIPELEGIRGILSLLVLSGHVRWEPIPWFASCMEFFFVISGYLITTILLRAPSITPAFLKAYAVRRSLRIWPMYYVALLLYFGVSGWVLPHTDFRWLDRDVSWAPAWLPFALSAIFLQHTDSAFGPPTAPYPELFGHSWSVAIEEQFYFLWPLLFLLVRKATRPLGIVLLCSVLAFTMIFRGVVHLEGGLVGLWLLPARLESLGLGIVLAFLIPAAQRAGASALRELTRCLRWVAVLGFAMLIPHLAQGYGLADLAPPALLAWTVFFPTFGSAVLAFGLVGLVILGSGRGSLALLRQPVLMYLGKISYSTYLLHVLVVVVVTLFMQHYAIESVLFQWLCSLVLAVGLSHLTYRHVEMRAMAFKARFPYSSRPPDPGRDDGVPARAALRHAG